MEKLAVLFSAAVLLAGCGPTNSPVTVGGHTLTPQSALMFNILFPGMSGTWVVISDQPDICGAVETNSCTMSSGFVRNGTALSLLVPGTEPGAYTVGENQERFDKAEVSFAKLENGKATFEAKATAGTVTLESSGLNEHARGTYDITMSDGTKLRGTFTGEYCEKLKDFSFSGGMSCQFSGGATSCQGSCTCEQKTVEANCTRSDESSDWACTCTNASGIQSSCSVPATEQNACSDTGACCPMSF